VWVLNQKMKVIIQFSLVLLLLCNFNVFAQNLEPEIQDNHDSGVERHYHHFHPNHIVIFTGASTQIEEDNFTNF